MGTLIQENDSISLSKKHFNIVSHTKELTKREYEDVLFSFKVVKHMKSNAVIG